VEEPSGTADRRSSGDDRAPADRSPDDRWGRIAATRRFAHPFDPARFERFVPKEARVLDVGCGWGRLLAAVHDAGWTRDSGADPSPGMIALGRERRPDLDLVVADGRALPWPDGTFDAALLFTVLTCVPADDDQRALVTEIRRVLRPGGLLYVSDCLLNADARNLARYEAARGRGGPGSRWGTFSTDDGMSFRHHDRAWLRELFAAFDEEEFVEFTAETMYGHTTNAFQALLRRR
jgi:SAM-dependent methyltransferase